MWYIAVLLSALAVDLIPIVAPPAWMVMVTFMVRFQLNPWAVLAAGVVGSTAGRYLFSLYVPHVADRLIKRHKKEDLEFLGSKLKRCTWQSWLFVFLYTLTPLSTSALFTAAATANVGARQILPPFFAGKLLSDAVMIFAGGYAVQRLMEETFSPKGVLIMSTGLAIVAAMLFINWRSLLQQRKFSLNFRIWK